MRSDRYWSNQPVLILAERHDSELVQQALRYGADDVITKPIASSELVARIYNRLEKYRQLQRLAAADNLTGLVNQRRAREVLSLLLGLAQRYRQPLTLVVIQLSPPAAGEAIAPGLHLQQLIQLAARLQRSCRREDVVARWTDEQFVLGFYGVSWSIAIQRIEQVKLLLQQSRDSLPESAGQVPIRISAGIAEFPIHGTDLSSLTDAANAVLSSALEQGGDRIVVAEGRTFSASTASEDLFN